MENVAHILNKDSIVKLKPWLEILTTCERSEGGHWKSNRSDLLIFKADWEKDFNVPLVVEFINRDGAVTFKRKPSNTYMLEWLTTL
jgi:hypothetical protein